MESKSGSDREKKRVTINDNVFDTTIGKTGKWQILMATFLYLGKLPIAFHQLNYIAIAPPIYNVTCENNTIPPCSDACVFREFDDPYFIKTAATQFDLVCDSAGARPLVNTVTLIGIVFGNIIFAFYADKWGRKLPLIVASGSQLIFGFASALIPYLWAFFLARFFAGAATGGIQVISFVLLFEILGGKERIVIIVLFNIPFCVGHACLGGTTYIFDDWRYIGIVVASSSLVLFPYFCFLMESPRWLILKNKIPEAIRALEYAGSINKMPVSSINQLVVTYVEENLQNLEDDTFLFKNVTLTKYWICISFSWWTYGFCYIGLSEFMTHNYYSQFQLTFLASGIVCIIGSASALGFLFLTGRKKVLLLSNLLSGAPCLCIMAMKQFRWLHPYLSLISISGLSLQFSCVYIYTAEIFPTSTRSFALGASCTWASIGTVCAPFIITSGFDYWLPLFFGLPPLVSFPFILYLPETRNKKLFESIREFEYEYKMKTKQYLSHIINRATGTFTEIPSDVPENIFKRKESLKLGKRDSFPLEVRGVGRKFSKYVETQPVDEKTVKNTFRPSLQDSQFIPSSKKGDRKKSFTEWGERKKSVSEWGERKKSLAEWGERKKSLSEERKKSMVGVEKRKSILDGERKRINVDWDSSKIVLEEEEEKKELGLNKISLVNDTEIQKNLLADDMKKNTLEPQTKRKLFDIKTNKISANENQKKKITDIGMAINSLAGETTTEKAKIKNQTEQTETEREESYLTQEVFLNKMKTDDIIEKRRRSSMVRDEGEIADARSSKANFHTLVMKDGRKPKVSSLEIRNVALVKTASVISLEKFRPQENQKKHKKNH